MTVKDIMNIPGISPVNIEPEDKNISSIFCCDLLSVAMSRAPEEGAWVTVIGNVNTIAVAALAEVSCIILSEGFSFDKEAVEAAKGKVTLLQSNQPTYETAAGIGALL